MRFVKKIIASQGANYQEASKASNLCIFLKHAPKIEYIYLDIYLTTSNMTKVCNAMKERAGVSRLCSLHISQYNITKCHEF